ncbi:hypothetical protein [Nocardia sp. R6R-6]|uniref:hypothetical protein n=1 Tax=Nocardia sp. R6R-6 TaxID=3459303 RepID=UPI00403DF2BA
MPDDSEDRNTAEERDDALEPWAPLKAWERWLAAVLGVATAVSGTVAVFLSDNQAGTAALFILAAALLLMGIQGTPLSSFGSGEHGMRFMQRRLGEQLLRIGKSQDNEEAARAYVDAAAIVAPSVGGSAAGRAILYEAALAEALARLSGVPVRKIEADGHVDFEVDFPDRPVGIIAKYLRNPMSVSMFLKITRHAPRLVPQLVVVNRASQALRAEMSRPDAANLFGNVRVVEWGGPMEDHDLQVALRELTADQGESDGTTAG